MARIDDLPADQRAVLSLLVRRGRGYAEIAQALDIDEQEVRARASAAIEALAGAHAAKLDRRERERIGDYVLGQLDASERLVVYDEIEGSDEARAYADALGVALDLAQARTTERAEGDRQRGRPAGPRRSSRTGRPGRSGRPGAQESFGRAASASSAAAPGAPATAGPADPERRSAGSVPRSLRWPLRGRGLPRGAEAPPRGAPAPPGLRSSRLGGALLLGAILAGIVVAIVLTVTGGGPGHAASGRASTGPSTGSSGAGATGAGGVHINHELGLTAPAGSGSSAVGVAAVLSSPKKPSLHALALTAEKLPPTHGFFYVAWLYNSASSYELLGKSPPVGANGELVPSITPLGAHASSFRELVVTKESAEHPSHPGQIVLHGAFALH